MKRTSASLTEFTQQNHTTDSETFSSADFPQFLKKIADTVPGLVCVYNIHTGTYSYINNSLTKILGYPKKDWLEKGLEFVSTLVHPDDVKRIFTENKKALTLANKKSFTTSPNDPIVAFEYRVLHKDGSWRWLKTDGVIFSRNKQGKVEEVMNISVDITERKEAELKESEKRKQAEEDRAESIAKMSNILEYLTDVYFELDSKYRYVQLNKRAEELAGKKKQEMLGKSILDLYPQVKQTPFYQAMKQALTKKKIVTVEGFYSPRQKWYENSYYPTETGLIVFSKDITLQKKLREVEKYFTAIVASSDDAIVSKNLNSIITSWNKAAEDMFGYSAEEIVGKSITLTIPKELQKEEKIILSQIKKGKRLNHFETIRMRKDGSRLAVSLTISPIKDESGTIIGASNIARDITRQKQTEENLRFLSEASKIISSSLDYSKTLQDVAKIAVSHIADWCGIDILEPDGTLKQVAVSHIDPKKVAWAKAYRKANPPDMTSDTGMPQVIKSKKSVLYPVITDEMLVSSAKNEKQLSLARSLNFTSVMIVPITCQKKTIGAISFITTDGGRQYTHNDLAMAEELASRAALAIDNAMLYDQAQREIEQRKRLEKQKDEFIGVASHELKTPVTSIKSFAQVLHLKFTREGNTQAAELLGKLDAQVDKLTSLIGDLLDVTKIEAGRMQFNTDYFSFDELVDELIEEMQRTTDKHTLVKQGNTDQKIFGDRERLGQVITNLISNAIKYSPYSKEIIIHSAVEKKHVKLCVQDFGIGIAEDKKDKVFERFFRASGPGQETYPGLGLGLYVSSEIIRRLSGRLWVESREGKGSTFCFLLPIDSRKKTKPAESKQSK